MLRTTAYQLINEMHQDLTKLGYRVQRGKVNRQYVMEKYCYENELRKEVRRRVHIKMKIKTALGVAGSVMWLADSCRARLFQG